MVRMNTKTKNLVECAILIALSTVLSFVKFWEMPYGGSVTLLSMLPVCMVGIRLGTAYGLASSFVYGVLQMLVSGAVGWGLSPTAFVVCLLFDYIIAFAVLGFSGVFRKLGLFGQLSGIALACVLRFVCHYISGVTIWKESALEYAMNPYLYSLLYNGTYMAAELVLTIVGAYFVINALRKQKLA